MDNGLLMCRWCTNVWDDVERSTANQNVVPVCYRQVILSLAHDHALSGYLGIKTYNQILKHFVWPRLSLM